ncbi:hypothetical protein [Streptomyces sp. Rer75]|uniref:hypothetical protein n=1 Tax=unclassified Streptomyces TaxID=2593676 RepID=UPI0015D088F2|nr:hypothetical protein [Streptomyces sp. Rer75]QLH19274.1 hypothetical protein HYQ63_41760 [Streptomyces sp. Rer75]
MSASVMRTWGAHQVGFQSWLARDGLVLMDFDLEAAGIAWQLLWLHWHGGERERRHVPDCCVRRADGSGVWPSPRRASPSRTAFGTSSTTP